MSLFVPPGHFYSPIYLPQGKINLSEDGPKLGEINLNTEVQMENLITISELGELFPNEKDGSGFYYSNNDQFAEGDAFVYSGVLKYLNPHRVIEIGSGYSTAVLLDTKPKLSNLKKITLIEPYPERLLSLVEIDSGTHLIRSNVQDVPLEVFRELRNGDILFIDSSHVAKTGSDVLFEINSILPELAPGVWVHIHDMFWPFEYPLDWVMQGRSWNELYFVRAWLAYNKKVSVQFFSHYLYSQFRDQWNRAIPPVIHNPGGGLWLRIEM